MSGRIFFVPPLKCMVLDKISVVLCSCKDILYSIPTNKILRNYKTSVQMIDAWILENSDTTHKRISELPIPPNLALEIAETFSKIVYEIHFWKSSYMENNLVSQFSLEFFHLVQWTPLGEIDYSATSKNLVKFSSLDVAYRYCIACYHSLEDEILELQPVVNELIPERKVFHFAITDSQLASYWDNGCILDPSTRFSHLIWLSIKANNVSSLKYFFHKLPPSERHIVLTFAEDVVRCPGYPHERFTYISTNMFLSLLSLLDEEQLSELFVKCGCHVMYFLITSRQKLFYRQMMDIVFPFLSPRDINNFLILISAKMDFSELFSYEDVFEEAWNKCSVSTKEYIVMQAISTRNMLLPTMNITNKIRGIQLLMPFANTLQRLKMKVILRHRIPEIIRIDVSEHSVRW